MTDILQQVQHKLNIPNLPSRKELAKVEIEKQSLQDLRSDTEKFLKRYKFPDSDVSQWPNDFTQDINDWSWLGKGELLYELGCFLCYVFVLWYPRYKDTVATENFENAFKKLDAYARSLSIPSFNAEKLFITICMEKSMFGSSTNKIKELLIDPEKLDMYSKIEPVKDADVYKKIINNKTVQISTILIHYPQRYNLWWTVQFRTHTILGLASCFVFNTGGWSPTSIPGDVLMPFIDITTDVHTQINKVTNEVRLQRIIEQGIPRHLNVTNDNINTDKTWSRVNDGVWNVVIILYPFNNDVDILTVISEVMHETLKYQLAFLYAPNVKTMNLYFGFLYNTAQFNAVRYKEEISYAITKEADNILEVYEKISRRIAPRNVKPGEKLTVWGHDLLIESNTDADFGFALREKDKKEVVYSIKRMIDLTKDDLVVDLDIKLLTPALEQKLWEDDKGNPIRPIDVLTFYNANNKDPWGHWERIEKASLDYPVLVYLITDRTYDVFDGLHRLCKVYLSTKTFVRCKIMTDTVLKQALMKPFVVQS